jgi:hypothetical protein
MAISATSATQALQKVATQLATLDWIDPETARQFSPMAEAVVNMFMVLYYQAETGGVTQADFQEALSAIRRTLAS